MRTSARFIRFVDVGVRTKSRAAWAAAIADALVQRVLAVARRVQWQYVSLVAGLSLAVTAVVWLSSAQNETVPAPLHVLARETAISPLVEDRSQVVVYLADSQEIAEAIWAMEREEEWVRFEAGSALSRKVVVFVAETLSEQAVIQAAFTGSQSVELGHDVLFIDLVADQEGPPG